MVWIVFVLLFECFNNETVESSKIIEYVRIEGYPKPLKYDSYPSNVSPTWRLVGKRTGPYLPSLVVKSNWLFSDRRRSAILFLNLLLELSYCGCNVNASGKTLSNGLLISIEPTSTRIAYAPFTHWAVVSIHFSFRIAPEQNVGSASGLSLRYLITKVACQGNEPSSARFPFAIRGSSLKCGVNAFFGSCNFNIFIR